MWNSMFQQQTIRQDQSTHYKKHARLLSHYVFIHHMVNFLCQFSVDVLFFWVFYLIPLASWQWKWSSLVHALGWTWPCFSVFNTRCAAALRMITVDSNQWRTLLPTQPNPEVQAAEEWGQRCVERYTGLMQTEGEPVHQVRSSLTSLYPRVRTSQTLIWLNVLLWSWSRFWLWILMIDVWQVQRHICMFDGT